MKVKRSKIGIVHSDSGLCVVFPRSDIHLLASRMRIDIDEFIRRYNGVNMPRLNMDEPTSVDVLQAVNVDGSINDVVAVGARNNILRFMRADEKPFSEWVKAHPKYPLINEGTDQFDEILYNELLLEYRSQLIRG